MKPEQPTSVQGRHRLLIRTSWFLILMLALFQLLVDTDVQTDIASFMPAGNNTEQRQLLAEIQQGAAARMWLIAVRGNRAADAQKIIAHSQMLAQNLRESGLFSSVLNGPAVDQNELAGRLFRYRYLLDDRINKNAFTVPELKNTLEQRLQEMSSPFSSFSKNLLASDPTAAMLHMTDRLQSSQSVLQTLDGVWYSDPDRQSLLIATSSAAGSDLDAQEQAYRYILNASAKARSSTDISVLVSGPPLFAVLTRDRIRTESQLLSITASVFMLAFMFFVFRSGSLVALSMLPLGAGLLVATAAVSMLFGSIHGITLAFGITLLGVAIDYPVHLFMHARDSRSLQQAAVTIWPILKLGVLTTALGYAAMIWTDFSGLSQLGVFSLVGLLTAALVTRTLLPALRQTVPIYSPHWLKKIPMFAGGRWRFLFGFSLLGFMLISLAGLTGSKDFLINDIWSHNVAELSPVPAALLQQDRQLRLQSGLPDATSMIHVEGQGIEDVLRKEEQLVPVLEQAAEKGFIASSVSAADIVPSSQAQRIRQSLLPEKEELSKRLNAALAGLPFKAESFDPFLQALAISKSMPVLKPADLRGSALGPVLDGLLVENQSGVTGVIHISGLHDSDALKQLLKDAAIPQVTFMNIRSGTSVLIEDFRQEMLSRIAWVAAVIVLVLLVGLKSLAKTVRVAVPVLLAVLFAAMVPLWLGNALTLFHLVSLLLVAGLGLDYALFFNSIKKDQSNAETVMFSLVICSISSLVVFAMLALSSIPVLHAIGVTVASGVIAAFVFSWMFMADER